MSKTWPVIVLGGSGYVAGELLRLVALHPRLELASAVSSSQAGEPVAAAFAHLAPLYAGTRFVTLEAALGRLPEAAHWVVLSAAPHCASGQLVDQLLAAGESAGTELTVVDASADFRFASAAAFADVYRHAHPAPSRLAQFRCAVPEHLAAIDTPHAAHPGCFATAMLLGIVPVLGAELNAGGFHVSAVTGSTGAGRTPRETTHHPLRQSNLFAYQVLEHRHAPEVRALAEAATGRVPQLAFVPHSGPFARGIHATIFAAARPGLTQPEVDDAFASFYAGSQFIRISSAPPRMKDIVASNYATLHPTLREGTLVICCVLDNLLKGAAGGSIQWVNRLLGLPETEGLTLPAAAWI